jgi:hypothetical protein
MSRASGLLTFVVWLLVAGLARAEVGDPQVRTDHAYYPGELACSTFPRLFATQAEMYQRVVGKRPVSDEEKAIASWLWRNTHYYHGEEGTEDLWGQGFTRGNDLRTREYWTGLFAHGFGLCGTTHSQWVAEMEALFGHGRGREVGVAGHNSFEVFLTGGSYGPGKWCLLDHDLSTVIYNADGSALLSLAEVHKDWKRLTDRRNAPGRQHGWLVCGLHPADGGSYQSYNSADYLAGYSGPPPLVHLRRGETFRRYLQPGLEDGKTFVFWGRDYNAGGIPGPERNLTWVNQPEAMHGSPGGAPPRTGQARYGNAVYTYRPDFKSGAYREGVVEESDRHVIFEFCTPYIIAATPTGAKPFGIYEPGCKNGLVLHGKADCAVAVSVDQGQTWHEVTFDDGLDLTDQVKGHRQYLLRFAAQAKKLVDAGLVITTVCQANPATMPRLKDNGSAVRCEASGRAVLSAGPNLAQARAHLVEGKFSSPRVTLELTPPRGATATEVHAAAHVASGSPPRTDVKYAIDVSTDGGKSWSPLVKDWTVNRRGEEPRDFWSQSFCWGSKDLPGARAVRVRFRNDGGRAYLRAEAHLVYQVPQTDTTQVTFAWTDDQGAHEASSTITPHATALWRIPTGRNVQTRWVEFTPVVRWPGRASRQE